MESSKTRHDKLPEREVRRAEDRGIASFGWLESRHTFSFGQYFDPNQVGFSDLLVINDDRVRAGAGFGTHSHKDMEIFSYVLEGDLEHKDSMGTGSIIRPGDVQMMSAGKGVSHSEFNHSKEAPVHFLQIWIVPDKNGLSPSYQQTHIKTSYKRGKLKTILSADGSDGSLRIHQDVRVFAGLLDGSETFSHATGPNRFAYYVHVVKGALRLSGEPLEEGDGMRVRVETPLVFSEGKNAEVLVFDLRARELPDLER